MDTSQNLSAWFWMEPEARRTWPRDKRRAEVMRNVTREIVKRLWRGGREASEFATEP